MARSTPIPGGSKLTVVTSLFDHSLDDGRAADIERLELSLDGWEGPLDLLLTLARSQRVDLREISILDLVEQYLTYIREATDLRLEIAADYLVMASWLAYLKSGLLLPRVEEADPGPEELAQRLAQRLQRLDAMREAGARLMARDRIGRDIFLRGDPEGLHRVKSSRWQDTLYDLLAAYGVVQFRNRPVIHMVSRRPVLTLEQALERLEQMLDVTFGWKALAEFLPADNDEALRRSSLASSFLACLELARLGRVELEQESVFGPLRVRALQ